MLRILIDYSDKHDLNKYMIYCKVGTSYVNNSYRIYLKRLMLEWVFILEIVYANVAKEFSKFNNKKKRFMQNLGIKYLKIYKFN